MATLSFKNINKIYENNVQAVFDFNLEVDDKEFIVFVGPSGCGKSTTLRMIAGLEDITGGQLLIDGLLVNNIVPKDRDIAMVFQSYALYPHMTVYGNMAFALKLRKVRFPLYEDNPEADSIRNENQTLFLEIKKINRQIKKAKEINGLLEQRDELYQKIFANEEKIKPLLKQKVGISELDIKETEALLRRLDKELKSNRNLLAKNAALIEKLKAKEQSVTEQEKKDEILESIQLLENYNNIVKDNTNQTEIQIETNQEKLKHFQNDEVPLFELRKHNRYEIDLEVYKTAKILDLVNYLYRKPAALSGGQRQRVALGRAIVRHPKVFLMDEPLSNLDAKLRVQMRNEITKIHRAVGATTIYVTHDQTEAMTMADRIVVMKDGYIQQIGVPKAVYDDPDNMFVAGFIGSPAMNFINGVFEKDSFVVKSEEFGKDLKIKLPKESIKLLSEYEGKEVVLGVRPENIYLDKDSNNKKPTASMKMKCDFVELLGYEYVLYTAINGQRLVIKTQNQEGIKAEQEFDVCFNEDLLFFFDKETTKRIR